MSASNLSQVCKCLLVDGYRIRTRGCNVHFENDKSYWTKVDAEARAKQNDFVDIVFSGAPGPDEQVFVETEDSSGASISIGYWVERPDGHWALRIPKPPTPADEG